MLIDKMIKESCNGQLSSMGKKQLGEVKEELEDLRLWSERWAMEVSNPPYEDRLVPFFVENEDGKPVEDFGYVRYWPGEEENRSIWRQTDDRIFVSFMRGKDLGLSRPSSFFAEAFRKYIYSKDVGCLYDNRPSEWAAALYLSYRIWSTARVAYRYSHDEFSTKVEILDDSTVFHYGKNQWWQEMVRRGLVKKR
jgi:hypothetical protein